jgi:hypothetical protein
MHEYSNQSTPVEPTEQKVKAKARKVRKTAKVSKARNACKARNRLLERTSRLLKDYAQLKSPYYATYGPGVVYPVFSIVKVARDIATAKYDNSFYHETWSDHRAGVAANAQSAVSELNGVFTKIGKLSRSSVAWTPQHSLCATVCVDQTNVTVPLFAVHVCNCDGIDGIKIVIGPSDLAAEANADNDKPVFIPFTKTNYKEAINTFRLWCTAYLSNLIVVY